MLVFCKHMVQMLLILGNRLFRDNIQLYPSLEFKESFPNTVNGIDARQNKLFFRRNNILDFLRNLSVGLAKVVYKQLKIHAAISVSVEMRRLGALEFVRSSRLVSGN